MRVVFPETPDSNSNPPLRVSGVYSRQDFADSKHLRFMNFVPNPGAGSRSPDLAAPGSVLIVDDDAVHRQLLRYTCEHLGVERIFEAGDGLTALEVAGTASPDLVLLDVMMPHLDGIETCRRLRADPRHEHLPILMQTALHDPEMRAGCFAAGATDFVTKPINLAEVVARVRVHLENRRLLRSLEDFHARMKLHLSLVGQLADSVLPGADDLARLQRNTGLSVDAFRRAREEVSGDFWTMRDFGDGRAVIILADAVGHGLAAAINALRVEAVLRELPQHGVSDLLAALDDRLAAIDDGRLTAAVAAVDYDAARSVATVCAAGVPTPLLLRDGRVSPVASGGLPVGTGLFTPRTDSFVLEPGDSLVLYSDGWAAGDPVRAAAILRDASAAGGVPSAAQLASRGGDGPADDLTIVILSRR